jgi:hypothetical protein
VNVEERSLSALKLFLISLLTLFSLSVAFGQTVEGEGRFNSEEDDSLAFVKQQLIASSFRDVITKDLKSLGLDAQLFWSKLDENFEEHFSQNKEKIDQRFGANGGQVASNKKRAYDSALRTSRLRGKASFGKLSRAIQSYSIERMSRSTSDSNQRYMKIQAKVDRKALNSIYLSVINEGVERSYKALIITIDTRFTDASWGDLGVDSESSFTQALMDHWKKWFEENLKVPVTAVVAGGPDDLIRLQEISKTNRENVSSDYQNSLWLKVTVSIRKKYENTVTKRRQLAVSGDYVLLDIGNNNPVDHFDFPTIEKTYETAEAQTLASQVASLVYRLPVEAFSTTAQRLATAPKSHQHFSLLVKNIGNIQDAFAFMKLLSDAGVTRQFAPELTAFTKSELRLGLNFSGDEEAAKTLLISLDQKSFGDRFISIPNKESPFDLVISKAQGSAGGVR